MDKDSLAHSNHKRIHLRLQTIFEPNTIKMASHRTVSRI